MGDLDLSDLTDDQLVGLLRAVAEEARRRNSAVAAAVNDAYLDETEKTRIAKEAAEREAAKLRAAERERVAKAAADEVRRKAEAQQATDARRRREEKEREEAEKIRAKQERRKALIREAAALCGTQPEETRVSVWLGHSGRKRIYIDRLASDEAQNLVIYYAGTGDRKPQGSIYTVKDLVGRKAELVDYCLARASRNSVSNTLDPADCLWTEEPAHV